MPWARRSAPPTRDAKATFSYDASSALVQQITQGAPADVFASADTANMDKLTAASLNGTEPVIFATNLLQIIVAPGNPKGITGVADLANPDLKVVVCAPEVPCGAYAKQIFDKAGTTVTPVSLEQNVKGVVTKVTAGEADAGIVYVTDVTAAGTKAAGVDIPADINVVAKYPIATVKTSTNQDVDQAFIDFLLGDRRPGDHGEVRLRLAVTTTAPVRPVAVHRRVGRERLPLPALILAIIAIGFFALPFVGLLWKAPWGDVWSILTSRQLAHRAATVAVLLDVGDGPGGPVRRPPRVAPGPGVVPGSGAGASALHAVDGAAAGRGRRRPVLRARPPRSGRPVPRPVVRHHAAVHDLRA